MACDLRIGDPELGDLEIRELPVTALAPKFAILGAHDLHVRKTGD